MKDAFQTLSSYHQRTKHHPRKFANSLGFLDWDNQPNPFRSYLDSEVVELKFLRKKCGLHYEQMLRREDIPLQPFHLESISQFLELSLALSAWKSVQNTSWSLRINPSSGNLHPTEAHLFLPGKTLGSDQALLAHYNPLKHCLEIRKRFTQPPESFGSFSSENGILVCLTSIYWRESWKYGERAFRYCNHDLGHALACLSLSASLLGWKVQLLSEYTHSQMEELFRFNQVDWIEGEKEEPEVLLSITPLGKEHQFNTIDRRLMAAVSKDQQRERVNRLSNEYYPWEIIEEVSLATQKTQFEKSKPTPVNQPFGFSFKQQSAQKILFQRRSAVSYDGTTYMEKKIFFSILDRTLPRSDYPPFDLNLGPTRTHLLLFVHRVHELEPGLYFFLRNPEDLDQVRELSHQELEWSLVPNDTNLPLYRLLPANLKMEAAMISCQQDIAGMSCFSLGMITRFRAELESSPWIYRHLFWETGMVGQILYLEAESHGFRGTGIGCFFDDLVHQVLGLNDDHYQSLYHFTIGGPVEDTRLTTLDAYHHLNQTLSK